MKKYQSASSPTPYVVSTRGRTALHHAKDAASITALMSRITDPKVKKAFLNHKDVHGCTALHYTQNAEMTLAILRSIPNQEDIKFLLSQKDEHGYTALHTIKDAEHASAILSSIPDPEDRKAFVNQKDINGRTVLHHAATLSAPAALELIGILLASGADPYLLDLDCRSPFACATDERVMDMLPPVDEYGCTPLHYVHDAKTAEAMLSIISDQKVRSEFIKHRDETGRTALHRVKDVGIARAILAGLNPADIKDFINQRDDNGSTALHYACESRGAEALPEMIELVRFLLEAGADPYLFDDYGHSAYAYADDAEVTAILPKIDHHGRTELHNAQNAATAREVLSHIKPEERSKVINLKDLYGGTALHYACELSSHDDAVELVTLLLAAGADPHARDEDDRTPRMHASDGAIMALLPEEEVVVGAAAAAAAASSVEEVAVHEEAAAPVAVLGNHDASNAEA